MRYEVKLCDLKSQLWETSVQYEIQSHCETKSKVWEMYNNIMRYKDTIVRNKFAIWNIVTLLDIKFQLPATKSQYEI